jgi:hypothetical protein
MTEEKYDENSKINIKNESMEILPMEANLLLINSSFNFFDSTAKKVKIDFDEDKDVLIVNAKSNQNKNI